MGTSFERETEEERNQNIEMLSLVIFFLNIVISVLWFFKCLWLCVVSVECVPVFKCA